jgi:ZIP family zinc transporter
MVFIIALGAFLSTVAGGLFALRFQDRLHLILGFSAGSVLGVAFFDLLPEAIEAGPGSVTATTSMIALGFFVYLILNRTLFVYSRSETRPGEARRGYLRAVTLAIHSCIDGMAIGFAFHISTQIGLVVAVGVLCHDFSDGINTIQAVSGPGISRNARLAWLFVDAVAPVGGALATFFISIPQEEFGRVLAVLCGFFLYIGAADLLPESEHAHPTRLTTAATLLGVGLLYAVARMVTQ